MERKFIDIRKQMATDTYQALVNSESPLATKTDHLKLQHQVDNINAQLAQIIRMMTKEDQPTHSDLHTMVIHSPPRIGKRPNKNRTPEKYTHDRVQSSQDTAFTSATSDLDEGMEGCEE